MILIFFFSLMLWSSPSETLTEIGRKIFIEVVIIPTIMGTIIVISRFFLEYLNPTKKEIFTGENYQKKDQEWSFRELSQNSLKFEENDKLIILTNIQSKLETDAFKEILEGIRKDLLVKVKVESYDEIFEKSYDRLKQEILDLSRRGNLNLLLGMLTTLAGLIFLGYILFSSFNGQSQQELFLHFVPRLSFAVLIEVFAYFFLRLYKQSLTEIKYFQNEITNIESKHIALKIVLNSNDKALKAKLTEELVKIERNFILTKDQTTVELERDRMAQNTDTNLIDIVKSLINKKIDG